MRLEQFRFALFLAALGITCSDPGKPEPSWVGLYTVRADTVRYCVENQAPPGRTCDCTTPGHLEGTLTLEADQDNNPTGEVKLRECPPGAACGAESAFPVIPFSGPPNPMPPPGEWLRFCAGLCPFRSDDDGMKFEALLPSTNLSGGFLRADGNARGCGVDSGPFTATRQ